MKTFDYLPNTDIYLYQDKDMFRINSDTRYLGEFLNIKKDDVVLDVGTNNGALLLYANKLGCRKLIGVDINKEAIKLCEENMKHNNINSYELHSCKVQELDVEKVDVIICNPPYFKSGKVKDNVNLANARHECTLTLFELIECSKKLLKDNGRIMMVYKSNDIAEVVSLLDLNGFGIVRLQFVFDENKNVSTCFLLEAVKNRKHNVKVIKPVVITH